MLTVGAILVGGTPDGRAENPNKTYQATVMEDECQWIESGKNPDPLTLTLVAPAEGRMTRFELLEDDGVWLRYQKSEVACTPIACRCEGRRLVVEIGPVAGAYRGQSETCGYTLALRGIGGTQTVSLPPATIRQKQAVRIELPASWL